MFASATPQQPSSRAQLQKHSCHRIPIGGCTPWAGLAHKPMHAHARGAALQLPQHSGRLLTLTRLPSAQRWPSSSVTSTSAAAALRTCSSSRSVLAAASSTPPPSSPSSSGGAAPEGSDAWWDNLKRGSILGPDAGGSLGLGPHGDAGQHGSLAEALLGSKGYSQMEAADRQEAQRQWDAMRSAAWQRYQKGEMPDWFDPEWIMQAEAPVNRMLRLEREQVEGGRDGQQDASSSGGGGGGSGGSGGDGGGGGNWGGFWREDDPYWPLRNWGDHPMRWWTFGFAAVLALGGALSYAVHGSVDSLWCGSILGAILSTSAMAMSDMTDWGHGPLAVKVAWATCALLALKEYLWGWSHRPVRTPLRPAPWDDPSTGVAAAAANPRLGLCGGASIVMCALYMWTGMAELDEWALPPNPGSVYKNGDVAYKHMVARQWGFGGAPMRT